VQSLGEETICVSTGVIAYRWILFA
jgi:hypothetical protein